MGCKLFKKTLSLMDCKLFQKTLSLMGCKMSEILTLEARAKPSLLTIAWSHSHDACKFLPAFFKPISQCYCKHSRIDLDVSSVKWSDPGHFLKSQGKFFWSFPFTLYYIFLTPKITDETPKSFLGRSILHYYLFCNI